jgi:glycosyltransferase involved in cell wall biosynthesis
VRCRCRSLRAGIPGRPPASNAGRTWSCSGGSRRSRHCRRATGGADGRSASGAGRAGGRPDEESLRADLADPASELHGNPDVRYHLDEVALPLNGETARWIGTVDGEAEDDLLRYARAALFTIDWNEPGGTAVCESLAAGTPVVPMTRGCLPYLVDPSVTGFLADNEAGFADALRRLGELDPVAYMAAAGELSTPVVMATAYERLYAGAISRASGAAAPGARAEEAAETVAG